eukprot:3242355-Pyramimonas_sp.AAC.1
MPRFEYLRRRFADRPNPCASRPHFALAAVEGEIMSDFAGGLEEHVPECYANALMLDGACGFISPVWALWPSIWTPWGRSTTRRSRRTSLT